MRGCLTLLVGVLVGAALMVYWWPRIPTGQALPATSDVRVSVADRYLTALVQRRAASVSVPAIDHVRIASQPPQLLIARADVGFGPVTAPVAIEFQPVAGNGKVHLNIIATHIAGVPVPAQLTQFVQGSIDDSINRSLRSAARVTGVVVTGQGLDISLDYQ